MGSADASRLGGIGQLREFVYRSQDHPVINQYPQIHGVICPWGGYRLAVCSRIDESQIAWREHFPHRLFFTGSHLRRSNRARLEHDLWQGYGYSEFYAGANWVAACLLALY